MSGDKILIVDDEPQVRGVLESILRTCEYDVTTAFDGTNALELAAEEDYAVAIVDLSMPKMSGMETIRLLKKQSPHLVIVIFTGNPTLESSIEAIREHVFDYMFKPVEMAILQNTVRKALEYRRLLVENQRLMRELEAERNQLQQEVTAAKRALEHRMRNSALFIGRSAGAEEIRHQVAKVAPSNVNILLLGESGTGKDVIAQLIHESSGRDPQAFVKVNCPAIPESLIESELFGYEAGAFTGATKRKPGRFEMASGGTLFLDEIGDLPFTLQSKLLQSVEQRQFYSVGGKKPINVDVRIVAATNAPLPEMISSGKFRADLYYRLSEYSVQIPPLRERKDDILLLADHFLNEYKKQFNCADINLPPEAQDRLYAYQWPGNIRELQSVIRRFVLTGLPETIMHLNPKCAGVEQEAFFAVPHNGGIANHFLAVPHNGGTEEYRKILACLQECKWNRRTAAERLGVSYSTLRRRIAEYNLKGA